MSTCINMRSLGILFHKNISKIYKPHQSMRCISWTSSCHQSDASSSSAAPSAPTLSTSLTPSHPSLPILTHRTLPDTSNVNLKITPPKEVWLESLTSKIKLGIVHLHPQVFGVFPRGDIIQKNLKWQQSYRKVDYTTLKVKHEFPGVSRKPWPQKGTGRARQGSIRAPHWMNGGWCHGPRGPTTSFYMLNHFVRVQGLTASLSAKWAQDDLKVVDTLENLPSDDPDMLLKLIEEKEWGPSVLFVDKHDLMPKNISLASEGIKHVNLMPVYGLNVYSMMKHETLVLTLAAVEEIEEKIMFQWKRTDLRQLNKRFKPPPVINL